jgi:hypothetical protein
MNQEKLEELAKVIAAAKYQPIEKALSYAEAGCF